MVLRLYKAPYIEFGRPREIRLLFEGTIHARPSPEVRDFYLYVWVYEMAYARSIQAILNNELVMEYKAPNTVNFGKIIQHPVGRVVGNAASPSEKETILEVVSAMENREFPSLIGHIGRAMKGLIPQTIPLTSAEKKYLKKLVKKHRLN